ncbi:MAG: Zn-ribbon domain-containing OB-fold protein [Haloarculaceae archaeon]
MSMDAYRCPNGHVTYPGHELCPVCGEEQDEAIDLSERRAEVITWTTSTATPPGVREPNTLAIVEFDVDGEASSAASGSRTESGDGETVRAIGQVTTDEVEIGDTVAPEYVEELREPGVGLKPVESDQEWDGYRFTPVQ